MLYALSVGGAPGSLKGTINDNSFVDSLFWSFSNTSLVTSSFVPIFTLKSLSKCTPPISSRKTEKTLQ